MTMAIMSVRWIWMRMRCVSFSREISMDALISSTGMSTGLCGIRCEEEPGRTARRVCPDRRRSRIFREAA